MLKKHFFQNLLLFLGFTVSGADFLSQSKTGFLLYEKENSSYFFSQKIQAQVNNASSIISTQGNYLYGKSNRSDINGSLHYGNVEIDYSKQAYGITASLSGWTIPDELKILNGKPRFSINDFSGISASAKFRKNFCIDDKNFNISQSLLYGHSETNSGDLYYFYGKPDNFFAFGGLTQIDFPKAIQMSLMYGKLKFDLLTNNNKNLGDLSANLMMISLSKEFALSTIYIKPTLGFFSVSIDGNCMATNQTQTYSLFPYIYCGGNLYESIQFLSTGTTVKYEYGNHFFNFDIFYLFSVRNYSNGNYLYKYKKTLFFDGSSNQEELQMPDLAGNHIFLGNIDYIYNFQTKYNVKLSLEIEKLIAAAILKDSSRNFFRSSFSSDSTASLNSNSSKNSKIINNIEKLLLSGLSISLKIKF